MGACVGVTFDHKRVPTVPPLSSICASQCVACGAGSGRSVRGGLAFLSECADRAPVVAYTVMSIGMHVWMYMDLTRLQQVWLEQDQC